MKKIIVLILIISALLLSSCGKESNETPTSTEINQSNEKNDSGEVSISSESNDTKKEDNPTKNTETELEDYHTKVEKNKIKEETIKYKRFSNISECNTLKITVDSCKDYFYLNAAVAEGSNIFCDKIKLEENKKTCYNDITKVNALKNLNPDECLKLEDETLKNNCIKEVEYISKVSSEKEKNETQYAKAMKSRYIITCNTINDELLKDKCINDKIVANMDLSMCDSLYKTLKEENECRDKHAYDVDNAILLKAYTTKDKDLCKRLSTEAKVTTCEALEI